MAWKKWTGGVAYFAAGVLVAVVIQRALAIRSRGLQIGNLVKGRAYVEALETYRASHHAYPPSLDPVLHQAPLELDGRDAWDTRMVYQSDGRRFVLISFGADRRQDYYGDPMDLRLSAVTPQHAPFPFWSTCGDPAADQVMSDLGEHRICGK